MDAQKYGNNILEREKIKLCIGTIEAQHERLLDQIESGVTDAELEVILRMALKTFEDNYLNLQKIINKL